MGGDSSTAPASARATFPALTSAAARPSASSGPASRWVTVMLGPRAWQAMATCAAGALATHSVNRNGEAVSGPSARIPRSRRSVNEAGPNAVAITTSVRPASPLPPASAMAMRAAATASFEGGLMRRAAAAVTQAVRSAAPTSAAWRALSGRWYPAERSTSESTGRDLRSASARAPTPHPKLPITPTPVTAAAPTSVPARQDEGDVGTPEGQAGRDGRAGVGHGLRDIEHETSADGRVHAAPARSGVDL